MLQMRHICDLHIDLSPPLEIGEAAPGFNQRIIRITGGSVTGERLNGTVLEGGADWQIVYKDGIAELDARYIVQTDDGALIDVRNWGLRHGPEDVIARLAKGEEVDPKLYYMRTTPRFRAAAPRYNWLNKVVGIGTGARFPSHVSLTLYEIL